MQDISKRADKRVNNPPIVSVVRSGENSHNVNILNISRKGLRFRSGVEYNKGDKMTFDFSKGDADVSLSLSIRGKIVNEYGATANADTYEYGVKFFSLLHWHEMSIIHSFVYAISKR